MKFKHNLFLAIALLQASFGYSADWNQFNFNNQQKNAALATTAVATMSYISYQYAQQIATPAVIIDIKNLAIEKANFPANFDFGVATSATQIEEIDKNNSWSPEFLKTITGKENLKNPSFACKSWENWQDDIDKVIHLGCTSYRFSIEWSKIQPTADSFNEAAIAHYVEIVKYCQDHNIKPMICLHHYSDPIWFLNQGGFTKEENIAKFESYCKKMYEALRPYTSHWIVISQPVAYAVKSYKVGMMPPFLKNSGLENIVMLNMFKAHMHVYDIMHDSYNATKIGLEPQVGICHQIVQMQSSGSYRPAKRALEELVAVFGDRLYNQTLLRFFKDGHFQSLTPMKDIAYEPQAPNKFDFFALSYYSPLAFNWTKAGSPTTTLERTTLDNGRIIYESGMYDAIVKASALGKPVHVVENGINPKNEEQREFLLNAYLSAISQAITDGHDVQSYHHWTLSDNYEWANANLNGGEKIQNSKFGLYKNRVINDVTGELDSDFKNHDKMLKQSGLHYKNIITKQKEATSKGS